MYFQIKKLILWARNGEHKFKEIEFKQGKVNVITGASKTGKSAIIPIIDYCLGAGECTIPVNTIRDACSWFGVIVTDGTYEILLARPEPGMRKNTDEMMFFMDKEVEIPIVPKKNNNRESVCKTLDEMAKITFLNMDEDQDNGFNSRPSFRDMLAFCYQPQNIVANASTLFYKADTMEHRQKLINIFPYVLGAVDGSVLAKKRRLEYLRKILRQKERELKSLKEVSQKWDIEIKGWIKAAQSIGLLDSAIDVRTLTYDMCVEYMTQIARADLDRVFITSKDTENIIKELNSLRNEEREISYQLSINTRRKQEMDMYEENMRQYKDNLSIQHERLDLSDWLFELSQQQGGICPFCGAEHKDDSQITQLVENLRKIEAEEESIQELPISFEREYVLVCGEINKLTEQLNAIHTSIDIIERKSKEEARQKYTIKEIAKFVGKVEYAEETFRHINSDGNLENEIYHLQQDIDKLKEEISEKSIQDRIDFALRQVQDFIMNDLPNIDVEDPQAQVIIDYRNLTIKVRNKNGREDYLWELGSGSNWLAYHIAVTIAFQKYANSQKHSPIPQFLIYDQPSQVYFPQKKAYDGKDHENMLSDEDVNAVHSLFTLMNNSIKKCDGNVQFIVLEHAGENTWEGLENVHKICEWRGNNNKLIPEEWIR